MPRSPFHRVLYAALCSLLVFYATHSNASPTPLLRGDEREQRCSALLRKASEARSDARAEQYTDLFRLAEALPQAERRSCSCLDQLIVAVYQPQPILIEGVKRLLALGYVASDAEHNFHFLTHLQHKSGDPEIAEVIRQLLPKDYLTQKLYLGADRSQPAIHTYLRHTILEPNTALSGVLRRKEQLETALATATPSELASLLYELYGYWRQLERDQSGRPIDKPPLHWLRWVTEQVLLRANLKGIDGQSACLARVLVEAGESALLSKGLERGMDLDDCGKPETIDSLLDVALCRNDADTARVLLARRPSGKRFSLEPWLRCLPAREIGGPVEPRHNVLWLLTGLGGTFESSVENTSPRAALSLLGWPELAQALLVMSPNPTASAEEQTPSEEAKRYWLPKRLASIAGEDFASDGLSGDGLRDNEGDATSQPRVTEVKLGPALAPQYLLSGACGNVNCSMTFFGTDQGRYRILLQTAGYSWKPLARHRGLVGIDVAARSNATTHCQTQHEFDGNQFTEKRCFEIQEGRKHRVKCPPCP